MVEGLVVYQHDEHRYVPVVSRDWLVELVGSMHMESAHAGRDKLIDMVTQQVFCPGAANIVADVVGACKKCQLFKPSSHVKSPPTIRITASAPFDRGRLSDASPQWTRTHRVPCCGRPCIQVWYRGADSV